MSSRKRKGYASWHFASTNSRSRPKRPSQRAQEIGRRPGQSADRPAAPAGRAAGRKRRRRRPAARQDRRQPRAARYDRRSRAGPFSQSRRAARRRSCRQELTQVFEAAQREADAMKDEFVSTEHLLLALTKVDSKAKNVLKLNAVSRTEMLKALQAVRGSDPRHRSEPRRQVPGPGTLRHRPGRAGHAKASSIR